MPGSWTHRVVTASWAAASPAAVVRSPRRTSPTVRASSSAFSLSLYRSMSLTNRHTGSEDLAASWYPEAGAGPSTAGPSVAMPLSASRLVSAAPAGVAGRPEPASRTSGWPALTTTPSTRLTPTAATCWARAATECPPVSVSVGSPPPTSTRSPCTTPSTTGPVATTVVGKVA